MRIVFAGTPEAAVPSLKALLHSSHQVIAVLTRPPARVGRGRRLVNSPVAAVAAEFGLRTLTPKSAKDPEFAAELAELSPDAAAVVAYGVLLPRAVLSIPIHGWVNLHFSLLPAWRGAAPVQAAIRYGDQITGASTFLLEAGLDTGPVFGTVTEEIGGADTAGDLLGRLSRSGAELLVRTLDAIADGTAAPKTQPAEGISHANKVTAADSEIDWRVPASALDRFVRSLAPEPGAWTTFRGDRLGLEPVVPTPAGFDSVELAPGQLQASKSSVVVGTGSGLVELGQVRPAGRASMRATDWARGARITPGQSFQSAAGTGTPVQAAASPHRWPAEHATTRESV